MKYLVTFKKFLGFDLENRAWGQVFDTTIEALRPVVFLYPSGFFSIPKENDLVLVCKADDGDYLYLLGNQNNNTNIININNETKEIEINNVDGFNITVNGSVTINATDINLGGLGGALVVTTKDFTTGAVLDSMGFPCTLLVPTTTITKAK